MIATGIMIFGISMILMSYLAVMIGVRFWLYLVKTLTECKVLRYVEYGFTYIFVAAFTIFILALIIWLI